jgi:hypothetical protein
MTNLPPHRAHELRASHGQALVATFVVGLLYLESLRYPGALLWCLPLVVLLTVLLLPAVRLVRGHTPRRSPVLNWVVVGVLTAILAIEVISLVVGIVAGLEEPLTMLRSAALLWVTNWLVFTIWYWHIDAGGPHARHERERHTDGDFLFPQMTRETEGGDVAELRTWSPGFIDYLFLAFTTNTALSPTDAPALSRRAKGLMILQALISLCVIVLIAARAVNLLHQTASSP